MDRIDITLAVIAGLILLSLAMIMPGVIRMIVRVMVMTGNSLGYYR